jgi:hypothetical protein
MSYTYSDSTPKAFIIIKMGIGSVKLLALIYNFPSFIITFVLEMVSKFLL